MTFETIFCVDYDQVYIQVLISSKARLTGLVYRWARNNVDVQLCEVERCHKRVAVSYCDKSARGIS